MKILNYTPHAIVVRLADGTDRAFPPSGVVARVKTTDVPLEAVDGIPTVRMTFGEVEGLLPEEEGTICIVSSLVAQASGRSDLIAPNTGPTAIRENGQIVAVRGFQVF